MSKLIDVFIGFCMFASLIVAAPAKAQSIESSEAFEQQLSTYPGVKFNMSQNAVSCFATTICPNGFTLSCQTFGYQYVNLPGYFNNCSWFVVPGRGVRCQGYQQVPGPFGYRWAYVDLPFSCY